MFALMLFLATLAPAARPDDGLADQIAHCGIARDQISARYENDLQDETATIATPSSALTNASLNCLAALAQSGRIFAFTDPAAQARYDPLIAASDRKQAQQEARQWLTDHGLLDKLPVYDPPRQSLADFAASLEALCGVARGTRLRVTGPKALIFVAPTNLDLDEPSMTAFECVISATLATDLDTKGISLGFIGNEQTAPAK